jgi:hypothetical protein
MVLKKLIHDKFLFKKYGFNKKICFLQNKKINE